MRGVFVVTDGHDAVYCGFLQLLLTLSARCVGPQGKFRGQGACAQKIRAPI